MFESNTEALVNPVNCAGVMEKGLALAFKNKFPDNYNAYRKVCQEHSLIPGSIYTYCLPKREVTTTKYIINFSTKDHWRDLSKLEYIESGLRARKNHR